MGVLGQTSMALLIQVSGVAGPMTFKTAMGLVWVDDPVVESYDERFYWSANNPKSLEDIQVVDTEGNPVLDIDGNQQIQQGLKNHWIQRTKQTAGSLLRDTDWYSVRQVETSLAIPQDVLDYRASVRSASNTIETSINACTTLTEFQDLFIVPVDADGRPTGKAPIHNFPDA